MNMTSGTRFLRAPHFYKYRLFKFNKKFKNSLYFTVNICYNKITLKKIWCIVATRASVFEYINKGMS
ncbi:MAG TPA: hypothetical protein DCQ76_05320 [Ruminococcaceae bacterium]|nr:hypothetical protein [Oscillospiraceae bacterium]